MTQQEMCTMKLNRFFQLSAIALVLAFAANCTQAGEYYRWVGEDGITHYGALPPKGVEAELVSTYGDKNKTGSQKTSEPAATKPETAQASAKAQVQRDKECAQERSRLTTLKNSGGRIRMAQPDGSSRYLTPEEVGQEIQSSELFLEKACG